MLAAAATAYILPRFGWRVLFLTGLLPALLTIWIQRKVKEPPLWTAKKAVSPWLDLFRPPFARTTWLATALATSHAVRVLGTQHLAAWISLGSTIARRRWSQRTPNQRMDFHHAIWNLPGLRQLRLAGRLVGPATGLPGLRHRGRDTHAHLRTHARVGRRVFRSLAARPGTRWSDSSEPDSSRCSER